MADYPLAPAEVLAALQRGLVIPAHPLALNSRRKLDERRQRALTRYYHAAGAGGVAVGVHTTQFAIRDPEHDLFAPVLRIAAEELRELDQAGAGTTVKIAGIAGGTQQAVAEAVTARKLGYHLGMVSLGALRGATNDVLVAHMDRIAREIPIMGFYLQPAAGGRLLDATFWRRAAEIPNLHAIKIAPFNRYQTLDTLRGVVSSGRASEIALYTGNDDNIVADLLTAFEIDGGAGTVRLRIVGGLLGHWSVWTRSAVNLLEKIHQIASAADDIPPELLTLGQQITESNAALFDPGNRFRGCIPGLHEILRRQGLLAGLWTLDREERLSLGQLDEIDRICKVYPHLTDDAFVAKHRDGWLS